MHYPMEIQWSLVTALHYLTCTKWVTFHVRYTDNVILQKKFVYSHHLKCVIIQLPPSIFAPKDYWTEFVFYLPFRVFIKIADFTQEVEIMNSTGRILLLTEVQSCSMYILLTITWNILVNIWSLVLQRNLGFTEESCCFSKSTAIL